MGHVLLNMEQVCNGCSQLKLFSSHFYRHRSKIGVLYDLAKSFFLISHGIVKNEYYAGVCKETNVHTYIPNFKKTCKCFAAAHPVKYTLLVRNKLTYNGTTRRIPVRRVWGANRSSSSSNAVIHTKVLYDIVYVKVCIWYYVVPLPLPPFSTSFTLTELVHRRLEAFLVSTRLALVSPLLVHDATSVALASVDSVAAYASHEKATAPVACVHTVVTARRNVPAHLAQDLSFSRIFLAGRRRKDIHLSFL